MEKYNKYDEAPEVEKESVTSRELGTLSKSTTELSMQIEHLENRLAGVLQSQPKITNAGSPEEQLTPVASLVRSTRREVDNANYALRSILSRLEL